MNYQFILELVTVYGIKILTALIVLIVGFWISGRVSRIFFKVMSKKDLDITLLNFGKGFINITIKVLVILTVMGMVGIQITSFIAILGAAGLAIGLALQGSLSNFAGGVIILVFKPYKIGDFIEAQSFMGTVKEIQMFNTILTTPDNKKIVIPNGSLANGAVVNFTTQDTRRVEWVFGVAYGTNYDEAEKIIKDVLLRDNRILNEPAPFIGLKEMADSSVNIVTRVWTKTGDFWGVFFDINKIVYRTFNEKGIEIPFPQVDVHMKK